MNRQIEFFYDVMSPYSHLAYWRLPGVAKRSASAVVLRPITLPKLLALTDNPDPQQVPAKRAYIQQDLEALSRYYGIPLEWPEAGPVASENAMALLTMLEGNAQAEMTKRLFEAVWVDSINIADPALLAELVGAEQWDLAESEEAQQRLQANTQEAFERGAFGVPSCFAGDRLFFGNERLFLLQMHLNA
ncbi:MAG: 2-hydroxychromene-2-carboxylate isomerase [Halopseudomonas sp.]